MIAGLTAQQEAEVRYGVRVGEPSNAVQIVPPPREEGRHVRWSSRTTPTADWWLLMIGNQDTCSCAHGPRAWDSTYQGSTCGTCGKPAGRHRRRINDTGQWAAAPYEPSRHARVGALANDLHRGTLLVMGEWFANEGRTGRHRA